MTKSQHTIQYIWQQDAWPHFSWDATALLEPLSRISHLQGVLYGRMSVLGAPEQGRSSLEAMCSELVASSEIEGVHLNPASVRSSIARRLGIDEYGVPAEDHYVEGLVDVMLDAVHNCCGPLTAERLFGWHSALFPTGRSGMYRITVGNWRQGCGPMQVISGAIGKENVHYEAPPSGRVGEEMNRLLAWCNSASYSPFIMAAVAHLWFVSIHPFDDGNGRVGRTLADLFLARLDAGNNRYYSMSAEINRNKKDYYEVLEKTQKGVDLNITSWLLWFMECLEKAMTRAIDSSVAVLKKGALWGRLADMQLNERQRKIVNRLLDGFDGRLTSSKYAKICHCSQDTALRDIKDLIGKGIIVCNGDGGRSTSYMLSKF